MHVLVINSGSSSIKYRLYEMEHETLRIAGTVERIGEPNSYSTFTRRSTDGTSEEHSKPLPIANHAAGLQEVLACLANTQPPGLMDSLYAIGHRVVHGGESYQAPAIIDKDVISTIRETIPLAPLHNPANLAGIEAMQRLYPDIPQVAVFDTAFFQTLPAHAYRYAVPNELYQRYQVRRYGFHGISHCYAARQAAGHLQKPLASLRLITLHLGNGASAAAIDKGIAIDTSMGMTPLEGLIMGSRCGDLDPSLPFYLAKHLGMQLGEIEALLNHDSGMKGLCGANDMREVHRMANQGDKQAQLALAMYCYRIGKYIGAYHTVLGGLDALVFTAGVGENDSNVRQSVCARLDVLGIEFDAQRNLGNINGVFEISKASSKVKVVVVPGNEELEIARQTADLVAQNAAI